MLDHGPCGGGGLFDYRRELQADEFAARLMLDDLDQLAEELALCGSVGHVAQVMSVTVDLLKTRLDTLTPAERQYVDERVWKIDAGRGA